MDANDKEATHTATINNVRAHKDPPSHGVKQSRTPPPWIRYGSVVRRGSLSLQDATWWNRRPVRRPFQALNFD